MQPLEVSWQPDSIPQHLHPFSLVWTPSLTRLEPLGQSDQLLTPCQQARLGRKLGRCPSPGVPQARVRTFRRSGLSLLKERCRILRDGTPLEALR